MVLNGLKLECRKFNNFQHQGIFVGEIQIGNIELTSETNYPYMFKDGKLYRFEANILGQVDDYSFFSKTIEEGLEWIKTKLYGE